MSEVPVVRTRALTKRFGTTDALIDLDLDIVPGEVFAYLGPNGAGKTTTLRLLVGAIRPTSGTAHIGGHDTWREPVAVHRLVGYVPGEPAVYGRLTGREHVEFVGHLRRGRPPAVAEELAERLALDLTRPARDLSRGNRQKLVLVLALMSRPGLLLLDEPTSGLDPLVQQEFREILREHVGDGGTVLLSSHVLGEVQRVADRVAVLRSGRLVAVERLEDMRGRALHRVRATFVGPVPGTTLADVPGLLDVVVEDSTVTCKAPESSLDGLLKAVSRHRVADFDCAEAELEETFLAYYGSEDGDSAA